ncbi:hypothetical protein Mapa_007154 [Marchantia paleacea]|nr:hypothetical protein Mapa_007154 [Marchantia paleacea]
MSGKALLIIRLVESHIQIRPTVYSMDHGNLSFVLLALITMSSYSVEAVHITGYLNDLNCRRGQTVTCANIVEGVCCDFNAANANSLSVLFERIMGGNFMSTWSGPGCNAEFQRKQNLVGSTRRFRCMNGLPAFGGAKWFVAEPDSTSPKNLNCTKIVKAIPM